jgi:prepilin-type N-terminal cleavage/methylation domain-containing protein
MTLAPRSVTTRARAGFSLIELMGVIVVLGLMAGMVAISWQSVLPRAELNRAVRELSSKLYTVRSDAIARKARFEVQYSFDSTENRPRGYRVVSPFRADGRGGLAARDEDRLAFEWEPLPASVKFKRLRVNGQELTEGVVSVFFDPLGTSTDHLVVLEQQPDNALFTIEVLALTGDFRLHDGEFVREPPLESDFK